MGAPFLAVFRTLGLRVQDAVRMTGCNTSAGACPPQGDRAGAKVAQASRLHRVSVLIGMAKVPAGADAPGTAVLVCRPSGGFLEAVSGEDEVWLLESGFKSQLQFLRAED